MRSAPRVSVTDTTIGNNSGVKPTAKATANKNDSSKERCNATFTSRVNSTSSKVKRMISKPNCRVPTSNAVGGASCARLTTICPSAVALPVRPISTRAEPLTTELPMNTVLEASSAQSSGASWPAFGALFSTG